MAVPWPCFSPPSLQMPRGEARPFSLPWKRRGRERHCDGVRGAWNGRRMALKVLGKKGKTPDNVLVGVAGFEPATPASRTQCSTGLSHTPTRTRLIALGFAHRKKPDEGRQTP